MTKPGFNRALAVGVLVAVCGAAFLIAFTFIRKGGYSEKDTYIAFAFFEDATGLTWKSRVQIAGIQVGEVERIVLVGNRARLDLRIRKDIDLRLDACLTKRFPSALLPDALLDAVPGSAGQQLRDLPPEQREIKCVIEATTVAKLLDSMSKISNDVQQVTRELAGMVSGSEGSIRQIITNLEHMTTRIDETVANGSDNVGAILENAASFTGTLAEVADADRQRYRAIAKNVEQATARLDKLLASVQQLVGSEEGGGDLRKSVVEARETLEHLNRSMVQVEKVAETVGQGKGVAGKLLNDERLGEKVSTTIESVSDYVDRLNKLQLAVHLRSEWLLNQRGAKTYAGLKLLPRPDKYYLFEIVNDPRGVNTVTSSTVDGTAPDGTPTHSVSTTSVNEQKVMFSLEFAKRYGPITFRIGLIESSGGAGADLHLLDDALRMSVNVYQFARQDNNASLPRAKIWFDYTFLKYFYATVGADDFLNQWRAGKYPGGPKFAIGNDVFFGGGLVFTDDDLKTLLGVVGGSAGSAASSANK